MKLYIEQGNNASTANKFICGTDTFVYVVDEDGTKTDISQMVRSADVRLHIGEAVTANLKVFVTGFKGNAELEELFIKKIRPRRWYSRKWRDITTFGSRTGARWFA